MQEAELGSTGHELLFESHEGHSGKGLLRTVTEARHVAGESVHADPKTPRCEAVAGRLECVGDPEIPAPRAAKESRFLQGLKPERGKEKQCQLSPLTLDTELQDLDLLWCGISSLRNNPYILKVRSM